MAGATSKYALPYPQPADAPNIPADVQSLATSLDGLIAAAAQGLASARPAAGKAGRSYLATDTLALSYDTGSAWLALGVLNTSGVLISTVTPGEAAAAGSVGTAADAGHVHPAPAFSGSGDITPAAPGQAVAAGSSGRFADGAHEHSTPAWGGSGDIGALAFGGAALAGAVGKYADAGHKHALPTAPSSVLGVCRYAPTTRTILNGSASTSLAAIDTTHATVSFTAPASGQVIVKLSGFIARTGSDANGWFGLLDHTSHAQVGDAIQVVTTSFQEVVVSADIVIAGLTSGSVYQWDFAAAGDPGGLMEVVAVATTTGALAANNGAPVLMIVTAA